MGENKSKLIYGKNLRDIRESLNLTQQQLADKLNTPRTVITMYENSRRFPSFKKHTQICDALDFDLADFPYFDSDLEFLKSQNQALTDKVTKLQNRNIDLKTQQYSDCLKKLADSEYKTVGEEIEALFLLEIEKNKELTDKVLELEVISRCKTEVKRLYTPPVSLDVEGAVSLSKRARVLKWVLSDEVQG